MSALLLPILAQALTASAGDYSEARIRSDDIGQHADLVTVGDFTLNLRTRRTIGTFQYVPQVTQLSLGESGSTLLFYNTGNLRLGTQLSRRTSISLSESAAYGIQNLRSLAVSGAQSNAAIPPGAPGASTPTAPGTTGGTTAGLGPGAPLVGAPRDTTIKTGSSATQFGIGHILDQKWAVLSLAEYIVSGGLDAESALVVPKMRTYAGNVALRRSLSRLDTGTLSASTSYTQTEPNINAVVETLTSTWARQVNRSVGFELTLGGAYLDSTSPTGDRFTSFMPVTGATFRVSKPTGVNGWVVKATASSSLSPFVDRRTGSVTGNLSNNVGIDLQRRRLLFQVTGFGTVALFNSANASLSSLYGATESVAYQLDRYHWTVSVGSRQTYQQFASNTRGLIVWAQFIALTYTTGPLPL